jgi:hypothetical protein
MNSLSLFLFWNGKLSIICNGLIFPIIHPEDNTTYINCLSGLYSAPKTFFVNLFIRTFAMPSVISACCHHRCPEHFGPGKPRSRIDDTLHCVHDLRTTKNKKIIR